MDSPYVSFGRAVLEGTSDMQMPGSSFPAVLESLQVQQSNHNADASDWDAEFTFSNIKLI